MDCSKLSYLNEGKKSKISKIKKYRQINVDKNVEKFQSLCTGGKVKQYSHFGWQFLKN